jgi:hypothetical protein
MVGDTAYTVDYSNASSLQIFKVVPQQQYLLVPIDHSVPMIDLRPAVLAVHRATLGRPPQLHSYCIDWQNPPH